MLSHLLAVVMETSDRLASSGRSTRTSRTQILDASTLSWWLAAGGVPAPAGMLRLERHLKPLKGPICC